MIKKLTRITVIVEQNGDTAHFFSSKKASDWIFNYSYSCAYQDEPWNPTFKIIKEECE